jgi:methionyl-tRNA formyltransferase
MSKKKIDIYSQNIHLVEFLNHSGYEINIIFAEHGKIDQDLYNFSIVHDIAFHVASNNEEINYLECFADVAISFGTGLIFKSNVIEKYKEGIINIHPGDLNRFRGRHPTGWAIIENEDFITISYHRITETIDAGPLIMESKIPLSITSTERQITEKIEKNIGENINYVIESNSKSDFSNLNINIGEYKKRLDSMFKVIEPNALSAKQLFGIVRMRSNYGGVIINGEVVNKCDFIHKYTDTSIYKVVTITSDQIKVGLL